MGLGFTQTFDVAEGVGIGSAQTAICLHHHGVDRANAPGNRVDLVQDRQGLHFVRNSQVAAGKTEHRQRAQGLLELRCLHRQRHIGASQSILRDPVAMDERRARVRYRPAHDAGQHKRLGVVAHRLTKCR